MINRLLRGGVAAILLAGLALLAPSPAAAIDPSYSGSWYNPPESGSGFNLEIYSDDNALLFWYTYDDAGQPVWLYSEGVIDGETIDFIVYYSDGMVFSDLDSADQVGRVWGSLTMTFQDCNTAEITYASTLTGLPHSPVGTRTLPVQRLVNIASLPCRGAVAGYWQGWHFDPTLNGGAGGYADLAGVLTEDGRLYLNSVASEEVFIGTYAVEGSNLVFDYRICTEGADCVDAVGSSSFASRDFIRGTGTTTQWGTQPFGLTYRTVYDRKPTLASLAGTWRIVEDGVTSTLTISTSGVVSGSNTEGCAFSGQLGLLNTNFNVFSFSGIISICDEDEWSGVVVNTDELPGDRRKLEFRLETNSGGLEFTVTRVPPGG